MRDYCDAQAGFWLNSKFWSKFSRIPLSGIKDQNTLPPILENFRFGMTKVYSRIPPLPNENCQRVQVRDFQNTESYYMWRLYPTRITTSSFFHCRDQQNNITIGGKATCRETLNVCCARTDRAGRPSAWPACDAIGVE